MLGRLRADRRGTIPITVGLMMAGLVGAGVSLDYGNAARTRSILQSAADSAALSAARELVFPNVDAKVVESVAQNYVTAMLKDKLDSITPKVAAIVLEDKKAVQVTITADVEPIISGAVGIPAIPVKAEALARMRGQAVCLIGLDPASKDTIALTTKAKLTAEGCATYSDSKNAGGLYLGNGAYMKAGLICSAGGVAGSKSAATPAPVSDCPPMGDPLATRAAPPVGACSYVDKEIEESSKTLYPGVYCGGLRITEDARVKLMPGVYVMKDGPLEVKGGARLEGTNVGFYFTGSKAVINIKTKTTISLTAPKDGPMAGFLFFEDRAAPLDRSHKILSDDAHTLLGTIYLSRGELNIDANKPVAQNSAYTIIVARRLRLDSGPNLVLNTDYFGTDVPFPDGVGVVGDTVSLAR